MSLIEIRGLTKSYHHQTVLDKIDLDIEKGDVVAIIGPSGTGKSTLLRCLNRLETADQGEIKIADQTYNLADLTKKRQAQLRQHTTMVFQQFNLFKHLTALQNVMEGLVTVKHYHRRDAKKVALSYLEKVGMADKINHYPQHLSGGQQQRVAIARALAMEPDLLLMDEPTSALDPELVNEVLKTIRQISNEGNTILLVTHEMNFVAQVATKVIFLEHGHIVAKGTPDEIFNHPTNERLKQFLFQINVLSGSEYQI